jgi:hypothetical protein
MIAFHRVLIATAIAFCGGMVLWALAAWRAGAGTGSVTLAAGFAFAGVLLAFYLRNLRRFLHR